MSRHGEVSLPLGGGDYLFRLGYGELRMLQEACDAGPLWIAQRIKGDQCRVEDIRETLRIGLIGGGMNDMEARRIVEREVEPRLFAYRETAYMVILAAVLGPDDEKSEGKAKGAAGRKARRSRGAKSPSLGSSDQPQSSASAQPTSTP